MYPNVEAEMARARMTRTKMARQMGITLGTLSLKLSGNTDFTFTEAIMIKKLLKVDIPIEEIFEEVKEEAA